MCLTSFKHLKKIFIFATKADPSPPLGTILGNIGVNTSAFCKEFNDFTKNLPDYFLLKVYIYVFDNRTFKFFVKFPSTGSIINLIKVEKKILVDKSEKVVWCIFLKDIIKISLLKFPHISLKKSVSIVLGSVKSKNLKII